MSSSRVKSVRILYATATGTAEDVAHALAQRYTIVGFDVNACAPIDSHTLLSLPVHAAKGCMFIFIVATAGDGVAPKCMTQMWTAMRSARLSRNSLAGVNVAVFGLGDRSYQKFNAAARRLATRIVDIGASLVVPLGLGDDSSAGGYDEELRPWVEHLFGSTVPDYEAGRLPSPLPAPPPRLRVQVQACPSNVLDSHASIDSTKWRRGQVRRCRPLYGAVGSVKENRVAVVEAIVCGNEVLTHPKELQDDREVRQIALDVSADTGGFDSYVPGDIVHVMSRNRLSAVQAFFQLVDGADPSSIIDVTGSPDDVASLNIRTPCTLSDFVAAQLDLSAMPRRRFIERLAAFSTNDLEREKLVEFASADGGDSFVQYAYREKRTILMVLRDFPSARPPLADLIDMIPALRPRAFSIASSRQAHGNRIHLCAAIVRYTTPLRFARVGICSALWLSAKVGDVVPIFLEQGTLRFDSSRPAILVGPGTGVAPMRSFVSSLPIESDGSQFASTIRVLYFGCRHARGDYLYETEWADSVKSCKLSRIEVAFSRDTPKKVYVQNVMLENADEVWKIVGGEAKGCVYIAGAAGDMPKAVRSAIALAAERIGGLSEAEAEHYVKRMESAHRLQIECW